MAAVYEHHLPNGMTLMFCRLPHLHSVQIGLYLKGGCLYESEQAQGISHLLEHLCFRGAGEMNHEALELQQCRFGTVLDGATYPEGVVFSQRVLPRFYNELLRLFHSYLECREWTDDEIEAEKRVVIQQILQDEADFDDTVEMKFRCSPNGAFPVMGTVDAITALSHQTIRLWQHMLFQPNNACLCIAGQLTKGMEATAIAYFSDLVNYTDQPPFIQTAPHGFCMRDEASDEVIEEEGSQASVHLAFDIDSECVYPIMDEIINSITAGSTDSLLFQQIREKALVGDIESYIEETGMYRRLVIRYDVTHDNLTRTLKETFQLLHRLCVYVRPVRMELSRRRFTDNLVFYDDDPEAMTELMGWSWMSGDTSRCDLESRARMYEDITSDDLQTTAQSIFRSENMCATICYDPQQCDMNIRTLLAELRNELM